MWGLHSLSNLNVVYYLPTGKTYTIGRKDTDIIIADDPSVSRRHANITIQNDVISISELKSKFGTTVNDTKVTTSDYELHHNDVILFGQGPSTYRLLLNKLTFCCSNMPVPMKKRLKIMVQQLGCVIVNDWNKSCTHLVMASVTVTVKAVNALSACCPIVTPSWIEESIKCVKDNRVLPPFKSHQPSIIDNNLTVNGYDVTLDPSPQRTHLFKNKRVYFIDNKQLSNLQYCITATEGTTYLLSGDTPPDSYCHDDSIVIDPGSTNNCNVIKETVLKELTSRNLRFITEAEIGHAILLISIDRFCNPLILLDNPPSHPLPSASLSQAPFSYQTQSTLYNTQQSDVTVLAQNTQLSQMGGVVGGANRHTGGILKVDETIIKDEPMDINNSQLIINEPLALQTNMGSVKVEPDSQSVSQSIVTRKQVPSIVSSSFNTTILAMDSLPSLTSPPYCNSSINLPNEAIISSAFNNRKRDRRSDIETHQTQQTGSNTTKQIKPETQTTLISDQHKEVQEDSITTERSPSPNPQSTPFNKPTTTSGDGFMSARKRTPVKSQSRTTENKTGRLGISPKRLRIDTQKDTENPLPIIDNNIINSGCGISNGCGFISARRRPLVIQPLVETEEKDTIIVDYPLPIVVTSELIMANKTVTVLPTVTLNTGQGIINYKRFKKTQTPDCHSNYDRIIGGSDLLVYATEVETN